MEIKIETELNNLNEKNMLGKMTPGQSGTNLLQPLIAQQNLNRRQSVITPKLLNKVNFLELEKLNILAAMGEDNNEVKEQSDDRENSPMH